MTDDRIARQRASDRDAPPLRAHRTHWLSIAFLVALLLVLATLRPLALPDEGRYGEIGRWMLVSGDWLIPRLNGIAFFHKPPLLYWLEALSLWLFGATAWSLRLVVALHAALMLVTTYLTVRRVAGGQVAHTAVWMLGSSLSFLIGGQYVNHDMLVAAWIGVAIGCFGLASMHGDRPDPWLSRAGFAACALGVLAKGLIGLVLPGLVLMIWLIATRQLGKVWRLPWASGLLIFCGIALPWFALAQLQFDQMLHYLFVKQHLQRYTESSFNNVQPWWFYGVALALLFFPWIGFVLYQAASSIWRQSLRLTSTPARAAALWWVWLLTVLLFFTIPNSKIVGYMLPVMPAAATLAALGWTAATAKVRHRNRWFALVCGINLVLAAGANTAAARHSFKHSARDAALEFACRASPGATVYAAGDYPYDFPFYARLTRPMVVVQDWAQARRRGGDNWRTELYEGADLAAGGDAALQSPEALVGAAKAGDNWVVAPNDFKVDGFVAVFRGRAWSLHRSVQAADRRSASKSPVAAENKGLAGCS